ncbi:acyl-CoA N-acyltransferase [Biscogniauxia marginata]|nr:acyl-CoA N-acyltransferase [Biscogniauxia marginata]
MPKTSFFLSEVDVADAENIARHVQVPAMQTGPLYRTMFPLSDTITEAQRGEIVRWYADMLEDAFQDRREIFLKASSIDGTLVGFCGWTIIERNCKHVEGSNSQANGQLNKEKRNKESWLPEAIDTNGWITLSKALRVERDRVLKNLDNICRMLVYVMIYSSLLTGPASRPDIYGGKSEVSAARDRFDDDATDL